MLQSLKNTIYDKNIYLICYDNSFIVTDLIELFQVRFEKLLIKMIDHLFLINAPLCGAFVVI